MSKKTLIVIDMQNDFVTGALKNPAAEAIIPNIKKKIEEYQSRGDEIIFTRDTHFANYLNTLEGKHLPVEHCIENTWGWEVVPELDIPECEHVNKTTFGHSFWDIKKDEKENVFERYFNEVELVGVCTSICVLSNSLIIKAMHPEVEVTVDASCCACITPESHAAALLAMKTAQVNVIGE